MRLGEAQAGYGRLRACDHEEIAESVLPSIGGERETDQLVLHQPELVRRFTPQ